MFITVPVIAKEIIQREVPQKLRAEIASVFEQGYKLTKEALKHITFLDWDLGSRHEGYLRPLAIGYLFKQKIDQKLIPLTYSFEYNRNKSHKFMILESGCIKMTLSQVNYTNSLARHAYFRDKLQETNQVRFVFDKNETVLSDKEEYYLLLTFSKGGDKPAFVNLGFPSNWSERVNLLLEPRLVHSTEDKLAEEEKILPKELVGLRDYIKEVENFGG